MSFISSNVSDSDTSKSEDEAKIWRIVFKPGLGVEMYMMSHEELEEVKNGEDRVGFLPRSYWTEMASSQQMSTYRKPDLMKSPTKVTETAHGFTL